MCFMIVKIGKSSWIDLIFGVKQCFNSHKANTLSNARRALSEAEKFYQNTIMFVHSSMSIQICRNSNMKKHISHIS